MVDDAKQSEGHTNVYDRLDNIRMSESERQLARAAPLEYDEPDPAPDFDDDECDDDEYGPTAVPTEPIGAVSDFYLPTISRNQPLLTQ